MFTGLVETIGSESSALPVLILCVQNGFMIVDDR